MATRPKTTYLLDGPDEIVDGELLDDNAASVSEDEQAFNSWREQFGSDNYILAKVDRIPTERTGRGQPKGEFLFTVAASEMDYFGLMQKLQREYGAGAYRVTLWDEKAGRIRAQRTFHVGEPKNVPEIRGESSGDILRAVAMMMDKQQERTERLMLEMQNNALRANGSGSDPAQMMMAMATAMKAMFEMMPKPEKNTVSIIEEIEKIKIIQSVFDKDSGGDSDSWVGILKSLGAPLLGAVAQMQQNQQPGPIPAAQAITYQQNPVPPQQPQPSPAQKLHAAKQQEVEHMKAQITALVNFAKQNREPGEVADMILDMTPENRLEDLLTFIERPDCVNFMVQMVPEAETVRHWLETLRGEILAQFADDPEGDLPDGADGATLAQTNAEPVTGADVPEPETTAVHADGDTRG